MEEFVFDNDLDIKKLNNTELCALSDKIRPQILETTKNNGGHLASNLGIVETVVALHYVFDFPKDKLVFDVGHQCYAHKILTHRDFSSIRKDGGISGFPNSEESEYDVFTTGHAGNSVSLSLGLCTARDKLKEDYTVVDVVGDGSLVNGLNLEAIYSSVEKPSGLIVILNDNGMSISPNKNGLYKLISKQTMSASYLRSKRRLKKVFGSSFVMKGLYKIRDFTKRLLNKNVLFEKTGFKYVGVIDGNDINELIKTLKKVKNASKEKAILLHVKTTKGKGLKEAEERADYYHGVGKNLEASVNSFSDKLGKELCELAKQDGSVVGITAGMKDGTGLKVLEEKFPNNFYDVGIAEEYAVSFSAGLAKGGLKPIVAIYSTFLQRSYDQILHDVCLSNLPVVFCIDRAGFVGYDGQTHQGLFDLSFLSHLPNMTILTPSTVEDLGECLKYAISLNSPVAIRYPSGKASRDDTPIPLKDNLWVIEKQGDKGVIFAVGGRMLDLAREIDGLSNNEFGIVRVRSIKPLDFNVLEKFKDMPIITLEENVKIGGFGSLLEGVMIDKYNNSKVSIVGVEDKFVKHGSVENQLKDCGFSAEEILKYFKG